MYLKIQVIANEKHRMFNCYTSCVFLLSFSGNGIETGQFKTQNGEIFLKSAGIKLKETIEA